MLKDICEICKCEESPNCHKVYNLNWETCNYCPPCEDIKGYWLHVCPDCGEIWCEDTMNAEHGDCICGREDVFPGWVHLCDCTKQEVELYAVECCIFKELTNKVGLYGGL